MPQVTAAGRTDPSPKPHGDLKGLDSNTLWPGELQTATIYSKPKTCFLDLLPRRKETTAYCLST